MRNTTTARATPTTSTTQAKPLTCIAATSAPAIVDGLPGAGGSQSLAAGRLSTPSIPAPFPPEFLARLHPDRVFAGPLDGRARPCRAPRRAPTGPSRGLRRRPRPLAAQRRRAEAAPRPARGDEDRLGPLLDERCGQRRHRRRPRRDRAP